MNVIIYVLVIIVLLFLVVILRNRMTSTIKGIVYFDIDDTLTTMKSADKELIIEYCLKRGYKVGIITASDRPLDFVCNKLSGISNIQRSPWMPDKLCKYMDENNFNTYNTMSLTAGNKENFPSFGNDIRTYGRKKGWQMKYGAKIYGIDAKNTFLFDDNINVIEGAKEQNPYGQFILVDNKISQQLLTVDLVKNIIK